VSTARVDFTRGAAERIAAVVRKVEQGDRDGAPLKFARIGTERFGGGGAVRVGTFTGGWPKGEFKTVTLTSSTATVSVRNVSLPLDINAQSPNAATRTVLFSLANGTHHAVEIEQGGLCGSWQEFLVTLDVENCSGAGAVAIVRDVNIGTTPAPVSNSGPGPIATIELLSGGANYAQRGREEPTVGVSAASTAVSFTLSYEQLTGTCSLPVWRIGGITAVGSTANFAPQTLTVAPLNSAIEVVPAVLTLNTAGASIVEAGAYYRESNSLSPYTHTLTVNVTQLPPSLGSGAAFTPVVNTDPTNTAFGQVTSITIDNGGDDYIAWQANGSIPFGNVDLALLPGFKAYETQMLGHADSCLQWFSVVECDDEESEE
jgi:hypothetical protein